MRKILLWASWAIAISATGQNWQTVPGSLTSVSAAQDGTVWGVNSAGNVFRRSGETWQNMPGSLVQVSTGSAANVWGVNGNGDVFQWNQSQWAARPGKLRQISAAADGSVWGTDSSENIFRWNQTTANWTQVSGNLRVVSAGSSQDVWGVTPANTVVRWNGSGWSPVTGQLQSISVAADRTVFGVLNSAAVRWTGSQWEPMPGASVAQVSVASANSQWGVSPTGAVMNRNGIQVQIVESKTVQIGGTLHVDPPISSTVLTSGQPTPIQAVPMPTGASISPSAGQLLCSGGSPGSATSPCGTAKAVYVGSYSLNMKCASGFFDPIYGGTCWKCPDDTDSHGDWIRSAKAVTEDDACWRVPKEYTGHATRVKNTPWPHECDSGTFWDGYSGGACWRCAEPTPRRTAYAVWADNACASSANETRRAAMLSFNGCPEPNVSKLRSDGKLDGRERPGKPFLDIAGGWNQGSASGGCFACPVVDKDGNFLITERNQRPIYGDNQGCNILLKYKPAAFTQPGLTGLAGARQVIIDANLLDARTVSAYLHAQAVANGNAHDSPAARAWVAQQWAEIAASPYRSNALRLIVLGALKAALNTPADARTPAQNALIAAMDQYVTGWRTYMAQQALDMYDAWKKWDSTNSSAYRKSSLVQLFDYGTVPLDFRSFAAALATPAAAGTALIGAITAASVIQSAGEKVAFIVQIGKGVEERAPLYWLMNGGRTMAELAKNASLVAGTVGGATVIAAAFAIISTVAVDQFQAIQTARSKLEAALAEAKKPVSLSEVTKARNGMDLVEFYWLSALDTATEREDSQIVQLAAAANSTAKATGYSVPR